MSVAAVNQIEDHKQYVKADKRELRSKVSRHNFSHKKQHLKYQTFPKANWQHGSNSLPETTVEIASFCSDFNARDILNSEGY